MVWLDRAGKAEGQVGPAGFWRDPRISPDGSRIAVVRFDARSEEGDIWLYDLARDVATRFTFHPAYYGGLQWTPNGGALLFDSNLAGVQDLYRKPLSGAAEPELLLRTPLWKALSDVSRDARLLLYTSLDPKTGTDLWVKPLGGSQEPFAILQTRFNESAARFSPDGRWIAYQSDESGRTEVYLRPFAQSGSGTQVSRAGGRAPRWSRDGRELYFLGSDSELMAVNTTDAPRIEVPKRLLVFPMGGLALSFGSVNEDYDVASDGRRFLAVVATSPATSSVALLLNWADTLGR
jgi:Tol biopolymer transport system component